MPSVLLYKVLVSPLELAVEFVALVRGEESSLLTLELEVQLLIVVGRQVAVIILILFICVKALVGGS